MYVAYPTTKKYLSVIVNKINAMIVNSGNEHFHFPAVISITSGK